MKPLNCHECQAHMIAYIHRDLPLRTRHRIGQHLNRCESCYAAYANQRHLSNELRTSIGFLGQPEKPQLGRMWTAIQQDMKRPRQVLPRYRTRYGAVLVVLMVALVLPWTLGTQQRALAVPPNYPVIQPTAATATPTRVANHTLTQTTVVYTETAIPVAKTPSVTDRALNTR
jgi:hypothetical protein